VPEDALYSDLPLLSRRRFHQLWSTLPQLTVVAAVPGWGRTTFLFEAEAFLREQRPDLEIARAFTRSQLLRLLNRDDDTERVIFADDLVEAETDPLWSEIARALTSRPWVRGLLSSIDSPPAMQVVELDTLVLTERDLGFTPAEAAEFVELTTGIDPARLGTDLAAGLRGEPATIAIRARTLRLQQRGDVWSAGKRAFDAAMPTLEPPLAVHGRISSRLWLALTHAQDLRWFSADHLRIHLASNPETREIDSDDVFYRIRDLPIFTVVPDGLTGADTLAWIPEMWKNFRAGRDELDIRAANERALATVRRVGNLLDELFYLLELGRSDDIEQLIKRDYVLFVLRTNPITERQLTDTVVDPTVSPVLRLLQADMQIRQGASDADLHAPLRRAFLALRSWPTSGFDDEFARASLLAELACRFGDRERARRYLDACAELVRQVRDRSPSATDAQRFATIAPYLAGLFRTAVQVDEHVLAEIFITASLAGTNPGEPVHYLRELFFVTVREEFGRLSLAGLIPPGRDSVRGLYIALRFLEEGNDEAAIEFLDLIVAQQPANASRSATDAVPMLVRGLVAPNSIADRDIARLLDRSAAAWGDGVPSSYVAYCATIAYLHRGQLRAAGDVVRRVAHVDTVYAKLARIVWALASGDVAGSVSILDPKLVEDIPRLSTLALVLAASSHLRLDNEDFAVWMLRRAWRRYEAPRLLRYALRFVPQDMYERIGDLADRLPDSFVRAYADAAPDARFATWRDPVQLSPSEIEIVRLLARGLKNHEIAEARHVTLGTVRTQLKSIYRKLEAPDRTAAIESARRQGLLSGGSAANVAAAD
jgi:DNA-binding CsgD family transcriptional regulator